MYNAITQLEGVSRYYDGGRVKALEDLTLRVDYQEWLTIIGPSGSGKSTLLHLMCGLDRPSRGHVFFEGKEPRSIREWTHLRSRKIGFVFQSFNLLPTLTTLENVALPMFGLVHSAKQRRSNALDLLERVGLANRARHRPTQLSGGERQRVAIARSLANSPTLILADEPTGNLDSSSARNIMKLLKEIHFKERISIVLVTHNPSMMNYDDRLVKVIDGSIV